MSRDILKEQQNIRTGNRYIIEAGEAKGVFSRDIDLLFVQYKNLRDKVYVDFSIAFNDFATKNELKSYIDEEFIKLCKEYEINSPVDFPYYIKTKLNARVRGTFIPMVYRNRKRERLGYSADYVNNLLEGTTSLFSIDEYNELVNTITTGVKLTSIEEETLGYLLSGSWSNKDITDMVVATHNIPRTQVKDTIEDLKELIANKLDYQK